MEPSDYRADTLHVLVRVAKTLLTLSTTSPLHDRFPIN